MFERSFGKYSVFSFQLSSIVLGTTNFSKYKTNLKVFKQIPIGTYFKTILPTYIMTIGN